MKSDVMTIGDTFDRFGIDFRTIQLADGRWRWQMAHDIGYGEEFKPDLETLASMDGYDTESEAIDAAYEYAELL